MRKTLYCFLFFFSAYANAQTNSVGDIASKLFPASPDSNNLMKFEEVPVSYYTGVPDVIIPLISIPTSNPNVSIDTSLKYHPLSAKYDDKAGVAGLGWNVIAGGTIARTVRGGIADDRSGRYSSTAASDLGIWGLYEKNRNPLNERLNGNYGSISLPEMNYYGIRGEYDTEYDLYQYNFMGHTGRFMVILNSSNQLEVKKLDQNNLKIFCNTNLNYIQSNSLTPSQFLIIDDMGVKYSFDVIETSSISNTVAESIGSNLGFNFAAYTYNSSFHLGNIYDQTDNLLAEFTYSEENAVLEVPEEEQLTKRSFIQSYANTCPLEDELGSKSVRTRTTQLVKRLEEIRVSGNRVIKFQYEEGRTDSNYGLNTTGLKKLTSVSSLIRTENVGDKIIDRYLLGYKNISTKYYKNLDIGSRTVSKLFLDTVDKIRVQDNTSQFSYSLNYGGEGNNQVFNIDNWGYYKDATTNQISTKDVLTSMIVPTGEKIEYNYEENTYSHVPRVNIDEEEERLELVCDENSYTYEDIDSEIYNLSSQKVDLFDIDHDQNVSFQFSFTSPQTIYEGKLRLFNLDNIETGGVLYPTYEITIRFCNSCFDEENNPLGNNLNYFFSRHLPSGRYKVELLSGNGYIENFLMSSHRNRTEVGTNCGNRKGGGVRIANIIKKSGDNYEFTDKRTDYLYKDVDNPLYSSGATAYPEPLFNYKEIYTYAGSTVQGNGGSYCNIYYNTDTNYNVLPFQKTQGGDVGYQYVTVLNTDGENHIGKTVYKFTSPKDHYNEDIVMYNRDLMIFPLLPIRNQDYKRGLLLESKIYNEEGKVLNFSENEYIFNEFSEKIGYRMIDPFYNNIVADRQAYYFGFMNTNMTPGYIPNHWYNVGGDIFFLLFDTYGSARKKTSKDINYTYETGGQRNNQTITSYVYNSNDYPTEVKQVFQDGAESISLTKYATETNNTSLISANMIGIPLVTETKVKNSGHAERRVSKTETEYENKLPKRVKSYPFESATPLEEIRFDSYDDRGNPTQYTVRNIQPVAIVWGYDKTQPIAKVEGANYSDIASMSVLSEMVTASNADATATANAGTEAALIAKQKAFRQALPNFQVTTYTYDPLIGVTSVAQPSGLREQYIYNQNTNQLEMIVDADGKVLKQFKYNYKH
ncbi:hypothetical protein [Chryseobacterium sp. FH1]|uniref:hypothetical protein n=1 Tax=Chryseobacterium sp. FH1 TaxID=1233951 RepID=UPI0004E31C1B|nr:hypothetical protein [Chryseobacterium sp. FH1]KFC19306.1 hypothetical protein IO90_08325 [Chryseobacterium sp. FH1]